ncbi:MAG: HNH endonuclease [Actinobacteria bacterium]|nr:HNH endonuclease [Actinomycetota bacterium]
MSAIRSALDEMTATAEDTMTLDELHADVVELTHVRQMIEVLLARRIGALADRDGHIEMGYPSPTAYLAHQGRMSPGHARRVVANANAAETAPASFAAWEDGRVSTDQAVQLFALAEALPDVFPMAEETIVEIIEDLTVPATARALEYWRQSVDGPSDLDPETQMMRRGVSLSKTTQGMRRIDGWLTAVAGEALEVALGALLPPPDVDDHRTPRQRRHDALEDLALAHLDHGNTPVVGGEKPHIMLVTDLDALRGLAGGIHETLDGEVIDVDTLRRIACDASITRIVLGGNSEILDVGRKTRVWTAAQRRAIIARDRHCTAPGCERPPDWCDIHHVDHWACGGTTSVDKGKLFCRFHHIREHIAERLRRRMRERIEG